MTKHEHLAAYVECKSAVPGSADSILILFTHEQRDTIVSALRALSPPEPTEAQVEAMAKAAFEIDWPKDDWSRFKPGDYVPERYRKIVRAALRAMPLQDHGKVVISKEWCLRAAEREGDSEVGAGVAAMDPTLCDDCPPVGYPTDKTRCLPCPRRMVAEDQTSGAK